MKILRLSFPALFAALVAAASPPPARAAGLSAGEGVADITPPAGTELAGFHKPPGKERRSTSVRQPAGARALVLSDAAGNTFALVSLDVCGVSQDFCRQVKADLAAKSRIPPENIRLTATHTHSMPTLRHFRQWGGLPADYRDLVAARIAEAVEAARNDLAPARLFLGRERVAGASHNRTSEKYRTDESFTKDSTDDERWLDTMLHALHFRREAPKGDLLWYQFSAHPVCYADESSGPDYPGLVASKMKAQTGLSPSFLQGHCGDVNSGASGRGDAEVVSDAIVTALKRAVEGGRPVEVDAIRQTATTFQAPLDLEFHRRQLEEYRADPSKCTGGQWVDAEFAREWHEVLSKWDLSRDSYAAPISAMSLGDVALLFHPGELYSVYGLTLRRDSPFRDTVVIGYTDDLIGYLPDPKAYAAREYSAMVVPKLLSLPCYRPEVGRALTAAGLDLLRRIAPAQAAAAPVPAAALTGAAAKEPAPARGPLRVHPDNPRYFTDGTRTPEGGLRAVFLTGSHTWNNLIDMAREDPPGGFDFDAYLGFLAERGHNFIRLWAWDSTLWDTRANGDLGKDFIHHVAPLPWERTGPGNALDGKPRFDLTKFNQAYFERLGSRVRAAGRRGIYVSVMLFEGWGLYHGNRGRAAQEGWAWRSHPFHPRNNLQELKIEGEDGPAGRVHVLGNQRVNELQATYLQKVVDTVNELDNVLYEVINEGGGKEWDRWVVRTIRERERTKPKQHPIGLTGHGAERLPAMLESDADWLSPGRADGYAEDPPAWDAKHRKVSLLDTDHVWGVGGSPDWVWKSFLRGHQPIFMDPWDGSVLGKPKDPRWEPLRLALGDARRFAERVELAGLAPENSLASSGYCLARRGREYLVYLPQGGTVKVDLSAARGELAVEWFDAAARKTLAAEPAAGGASRELKAPFTGAAVLFLRAKAAGPSASGDWIQLFNGRDLEGWTPKITGRELGDNWRNTFRVEDGLLKVAYDQYPEFGGHFGHLFWREKLSHYRLRVEYRFVGKQASGGPGWAVRNSGAMLHCQSPQSMGKDQEFPVSIEVQFLGGDGKNQRHTANLCTPGTHVEMEGKLVTRHCTDSTSETYHGNQWVTVEVEVRGNGLVRHLIDGRTVLEYSRPQLDEGDRDARKLLAEGAPKMVAEGYLSLQAESHPIEFRRVELLPLGE